jgi:uncharacterized protein
MTDVTSKNYHASSLDILKGLGLLALVLVNCNRWYTAAPLPDTIYNLHKSMPDTLVRQFLDYFVSGQCYAFLSFLLGIQFFNASKRESLQLRPDYLRRYLILFLAGLAHQALWNGDALVTYALSGILLVFLEKKGANISLFLGLLFISNLPGFFISLFILVLQGRPPEHSATVAVTNAVNFADTVEKGGILQLLFFNTTNLLSKYKHLLLTGQFFRVTGFFVLGFYGGRINFLQQVKNNARFFGLILMGCLALFLTLLYMQLSLYKQSNPLILDPAKCMVDNMQHAFGTASYLLAGILLLHFYQAKRILLPIAAVGKMWLSNYLFQTVIGIALFYGIGLKLYPDTSPLTNCMIGSGIFIIQLICSNIWLYYFYNGPAEWLWRSAASYRWRRMYRKMGE